MQESRTVYALEPEITPLSLTTGAIIPWVDEIRYLGIFIVRSRF